MKRVLIACDGAAVPPAVKAQPWYTQKTLSHRDSRANLRLRIQSPSDILLANVEDHAADLIRIASYVYGADQAISRGGDADAHGDSWKRDINLYIPVSDPGFWNDDSIRESLQETLSFASGDLWSFNFTQALEETRRLTLEMDPNAMLENPDCVYLFSGGLDSLCAVTEAVAANGRRPLLVSHSPAFNIRSRQSRLTFHPSR